MYCCNYSKFTGITILFFLNLLYLTSQSQGIKLKGGVNVNTINNYSRKFNPEYVYSDNIYSIGYYAGMSNEFKLNNNLYFDIGIDFVSRKFKDQNEIPYSSGYHSPNRPPVSFVKKMNVVTTFYSFEFPLMIGYKFINHKLNLSLGVVPNFSLINSKGQVTETSIFLGDTGTYMYDINEHQPTGINSFGWDAKFLSSYLVNRKVKLELAFQIGLANVFKDSMDDYYTFFYVGGRFYTFSLGIEYNLFNPKEN